MPIYEYECNACGERHEFIQKFGEGPKRKCPECGANRLRKLVSAAAFHLKGGGWYVTDFRDKGKKSNGAGDKAAGEEKKSDAAGETKTAAKDTADSASGKASKESKSGASGAGATTD